jgi:hypothetical protein
MPSKKIAAAPASSQEVAGPAKRDSKAEYLALMTWLSNSEHRNIITGAAGAAQNNGGMASGKLVVSVVGCPANANLRQNKAHFKAQASSEWLIYSLSAAAL